MKIARGVGIPLQLDETTKDQSYGYFVKVLVDVDLLASRPTFIMVEHDDHRGFSIEVIYKNLSGNVQSVKTVVMMLTSVTNLYQMTKADHVESGDAVEPKQFDATKKMPAFQVEIDHDGLIEGHGHREGTPPIVE
ncbi:hypothetical protein Dsin_020801 [Dipteronia sinensis]|uniref:Uncharacterized protein n=1 Tax=Dipteronia sinensis TaxID=43782 RepID=A0AAE0E407_9ROSI|nr:hypothetical protein Dsin_020801 [Dipteronia sinensis]